MDRLERNKQTAMAFYDLMFNRCKPRESVERYTGGVYIQHNPGIGDGKEPSSRTSNGMDIFRLDANGKVVEHWDVLQVIPQRGRARGPQSEGAVMPGR